MKFKVGDKVRFVKNKTDKKSKDENIGEVGVITSIDTTWSWPYTLDTIPEWLFKDEELQLVGGTMDDLQVGDILVNKDKEDFKVLAVLGEVILLSDGDIFDDAGGWFTVKELERFAYTLKGESEETVLTMSEVAEKFNVPVENLKIKKE